MKSISTAALFMAASSLQAGLIGNFVSQITVYDSPTAPRVGYEVEEGQNIFLNVAGEYGDSVSLAGGGGVFAGLSLEYYANYSRADGLTLRIYSLGPNGLPDTLLDSRLLGIRDGGATVSVDFAYNPANAVGSELAYSVEFSGLGNGQKAGLIVPDREPTVGTSPDSYLQRGSSGWGTASVGGILSGPRLTAVQRPDGSVELALRADAATRYQLRTWSGSADEDWRSVAFFVTDANGAAQFTLTETALGGHLYRADPAP